MFIKHEGMRQLVSNGNCPGFSMRTENEKVRISGIGHEPAEAWRDLGNT